jgi:hypothetical protein
LNPYIFIYFRVFYWQGTSKVEAICVEAYDPFEVFTDEEFRELPNLRFLRVDYADLVGDFKHLLLNLRWLQWHKCLGKSTITNFHLKNLVILDLSNNNYLKDDWEDWSQIKVSFLIYFHLLYFFVFLFSRHRLLLN